MFVRRALSAAILGVSSYVLAIALTLLFLFASYGIYGQFDLFHLPYPIRIALALTETIGVASISLAAIVAFPLLMARRLRANVLVAIVVGGLLVGISAHTFMLGVSSWNECTLHSSIPYDVAGCSE